MSALEIDIRSLALIQSVIALTFAGLMGLFWLGRRSLPGLSHWTIGATLFGLAIIGAALRGEIPDYLSVVAMNSALVLSLAFLWNGIRRLDGRPTRWRFPLLITLAVALFIADRTYVTNDIRIRMIVMSAILSIACFLCAHALVAGPVKSAAPNRRPDAGNRVLRQRSAGRQARDVALTLGKPQCAIGPGDDRHRTVTDLVVRRVAAGLEPEHLVGETAALIGELREPEGAVRPLGDALQFGAVVADGIEALEAARRQTADAAVFRKP